MGCKGSRVQISAFGSSTYKRFENPLYPCLYPLSMRLLAEWLQGSGSKSGPVFARAVGSNGIGDPLTAQIVSAVLRKVGQWIGLER